jgi:hypothetical protein
MPQSRQNGSARMNQLQEPTARPEVSIPSAREYSKTALQCVENRAWLLTHCSKSKPFYTPSLSRLQTSRLQIWFV